MKAIGQVATPLLGTIVGSALTPPPKPTPPPPMPDPLDPKALTAQRQQQAMVAAQRGNRASTILSSPTQDYTQSTFG